jgi:hypothetical protein
MHVFKSSISRFCSARSRCSIRSNPAVISERSAAMSSFVSVVLKPSSIMRAKSSVVVGGFSSYYSSIAGLRGVSSSSRREEARSWHVCPSEERRGHGLMAGHAGRPIR